MENCGFERIPANDADVIEDLHDLQVVRVVRSCSKKEKIRDVENGLEEAIPFDDSEDEEDNSLISGTTVLISLQHSKFRWFLNLTGNFTKPQLMSKYRYLCRSWQATFMTLILAYLLFQFGIVKVQGSTIKPMFRASSRFLLTTVHDVLWELKWFLAYFLGMAYHASGHLERFLVSLRLPRDVFAKGKRHAIYYAVTIVFAVVLLPTSCHVMKLYDFMRKELDLDELKKAAISGSLYLVFRIATVPSFCVVTAVLYLIKVQIDTLGRILKCINVNLGISYAEREIEGVNKKIRKADTKLKWYLVCHLILVMVTAFTGVFSLIERIHFNMAEMSNQTTTLVVQHLPLKEADIKPMLDKFVQLKEEMKSIRQGSYENHKADLENEITEETFQLQKMKALNAKNIKLQKLNQKLMNLSINFLLDTRMRQLNPGNMTTKIVRGGNGQTRLKVRFEKIDDLRIFSECLGNFVEAVILFVLPLMLLNWHQRAILRIKSEIFGLDMEEQRRRYLLIDCDNIRDKIVRKLENMHGVTIFGMQINFYKGAFITILTPFVTVALHLMFNSFGLK